MFALLLDIRQKRWCSYQIVAIQFAHCVSCIQDMSMFCMLRVPGSVCIASEVRSASLFIVAILNIMWPFFISSGVSISIFAFAFFLVNFSVVGCSFTKRYFAAGLIQRCISPYWRVHWRSRGKLGRYTFLSKTAFQPQEVQRRPTYNRSPRPPFGARCM